ALFAWLGGLEFRWVGYVAGAVAGLITGVLLNQQRYMASPVRWAFLALVPIVPAAGVGLVMQAKASKPEWQDAANKQRQKQEEQRVAAQQQKEKNRTKGERERFHNDLLPKVENAAEFIEKRWEDVSDVCDEDPKLRDANDLAKARRVVREAHDATDAALAAVEGFGKVESDVVESALIAANNNLKDQRALLEMIEKCLNSDVGIKDEEKRALRDQAEQTQKTRRIFNSKFKKGR